MDNTLTSNNNGNADNTILLYIYYSNSSISNDVMIIEKLIEIAILANLKQVNIGLYNISNNDDTIVKIINNIINNTKQRLILRYKIEKKHIINLHVNLIYFNDNNLTDAINKLLYETYYFPEKTENVKNIKGKY